MKKLFLVCNAHLDPVWQWEWEEGVGCAITTFSAAADYLDEYPGFIFCHNESFLYEAIEEYCPELFARIQKLVKAGRWHIMGGWYIQPDVNMPCGESIVRQILKGRNYFWERFGARPDIAANFDSFGHSAGLVQILADAGYKGYICHRPHTYPDGRNYVWKGFNGAELLLHRAPEGYNSLMGRAAEKIKYFLDNNKDENQMVLWGVGNHGGGPSRKDLNDIEALMRAGGKDYEIFHSTPAAFFEEIGKKRESLPVHNGSLNYFAQGCYTSQLRIKQLHMALENELFHTEKILAHAEANGLKYPAADIAAAETDLLFTEFHDILPGSSIKEAEDASLKRLSGVISDLSRLKFKAFLKLTGGEPKPSEGEYPIFVYNPHPYEAERDIVCEMMLADQNWSLTQHYAPKVLKDGKKVPCQLEKESSNLPLDWRKKVVFRGKLAPYSMNRFSCFMELKDVKAKNYNQSFSFEFCGKKIVINPKTGLIDEYSYNGKKMLPETALRINVVKGFVDPWGLDFNKYKTKIGAFKLMNGKEAAEFCAVDSDYLEPVRVIEDGGVRVVTEALLKYKTSAAVVRYSVSKADGVLSLSYKIFNNEKDKIFRLEIPTTLKKTKYLGKTCYGVQELDQNTDEVAAQEWTMLTDGESALSIINFGNYGSSSDGRTVQYTIVHSPAYTGHVLGDRTILPKDRFSPRIDQGERDFSFILNVSDYAPRRAAIEFESLMAHQQPFTVNFSPTGDGAAAQRFLTLDNKSVTVSALKKAADGKGFIIRLFNAADSMQSGEISSAPLGVKFKIGLKPLQFKSYRIYGGKARETNILEE